MAVLALVQSYPYDETLGGDAAYILALAGYLKESGSDVHVFVTDVSRKRVKPVYRSAYAIEQFNSWSVRGAVRLGKRTFLVPRPMHAVRVANKLTSHRLFKAATEDPPVETWAEREAHWVKRKLEHLRPDAVILVHEAVHFAPFLVGLGAKFALLGHIPSVQSLANWPVVHTGKDAPGLRYSSLFKRKLSSALAFADCVGLNSREDMEYAKAELGVKSAVFVGMGYADAKVHAESKEPIVLFVGNATQPNMAALTWFVSGVWPSILKSCPAARLRVVGRAAFAMDIPNLQQIERVGTVADLSPEYRRAQVVVVPLVSGTSGVKIKVAEAMAHGRPLVTTSLGVDALDPHQLDDGAIVADDSPDFGRAVISLLSDPGLRERKTIGAQKVFAERFSYNACYGEIAHWLENLAERD
jgi:glycosyltransferase involved in cell wall biosynthesis